MALITIIISLLIEKYYPDISRWRNFAWFQAYLGWIWQHVQTKQRWHGPVVVLVILTPILLITGLALHLLHDMSILLGFVAGLAIMIYALGPKNLHEQVQTFITARQRQDDARATQQVHAILGDIIPGKDEELFTLMIAKVFTEANTRLLAVLFWFLVLGPLGAALVRLSCLAASAGRSANNAAFQPDTASQGALDQLQYILIWIPARLTALGFAITGSFVHTFDMWRRYRDLTPYWPDLNHCMLVATGFGALQIKPAIGNTPGSELTLDHLQQALDLTLRAVFMWLAIYSILILTGWVGY